MARDASRLSRRRRGDRRSPPNSSSAKVSTVTTWTAMKPISSGPASACITPRAMQSIAQTTLSSTGAQAAARGTAARVASQARKAA